MSVRAWMAAVAILMAATTGWSQSERLGDVGGTIRLDPTALTEGGGTVIDPRQSRRADRELFDEVLADCAVAARRLADTIKDARASVLYLNEEIPVRLDQTSRDLEAAGQEIYSLRLADSFDGPLELAREAARICDDAAVSVREELGRNGVAFTEAMALTSSCRRQLEEVSLVLAGRTVAGPDDRGESTAESEVDDRVEAMCRSAGAAGSDALQSCLERQYRALAAIEARSAAIEMLDEGVFQGVRKLCRSRHPDDFEAIDECEQAGMTEARLEAESRQP